MPDFFLFNTLTRSKELLDPLERGHVRFYSCGPTVYDYPHIGNFRAYVVMDLLRRVLCRDRINSTHETLDLGRGFPTDPGQPLNAGV